MSTWCFIVQSLLLSPFRSLAMTKIHVVLTLVLLNPDIPCLGKQCRSRSVGFFRSQLIWICTVCHKVCELKTTIQIKQSDWLKIRSGHGILIYSAWQELKEVKYQILSILKFMYNKAEQNTKRVCVPLNLLPIKLSHINSWSRLFHLWIWTSTLIQKGVFTKIINAVINRIYFIAWFVLHLHL